MKKRFLLVVVISLSLFGQSCTSSSGGAFGMSNSVVVAAVILSPVILPVYAISKAFERERVRVCPHTSGKYKTLCQDTKDELTYYRGLVAMLRDKSERPENDVYSSLQTSVSKLYQTPNDTLLQEFMKDARELDRTPEKQNPAIAIMAGVFDLSNSFETEYPYNTPMLISDRHQTVPSGKVSANSALQREAVELLLRTYKNCALKEEEKLRAYGVAVSGTAEPKDREQYIHEAVPLVFASFEQSADYAIYDMLAWVIKWASSDAERMKYLERYTNFRDRCTKGYWQPDGWKLAALLAKYYQSEDAQKKMFRYLVDYDARLDKEGDGNGDSSERAFGYALWVETKDPVFLDLTVEFLTSKYSKFAKNKLLYESELSTFKGNYNTALSKMAEYISLYPEFIESFSFYQYANIAKYDETGTGSYGYKIPGKPLHYSYFAPKSYDSKPEWLIGETSDAEEFLKNFVESTRSCFKPERLRSSDYPSETGGATHAETGPATGEEKLCIDAVLEKSKI